MGKLHAAYWLLVVLPWVVSLALRIWQKNLSAHINKQTTEFPPVPTLGTLSDGKVKL